MGFFNKAIPQNGKTIGKKRGKRIPQNGQAIGKKRGKRIPQNGQAIEIYKKHSQSNGQAIGINKKKNELARPSSAPHCGVYIWFWIMI